MKGWKLERIIRVLLNYPDGILTKYRIAKEAETHPTWALKVIRQLNDKGFAKGTKVTNAKGLFDYWLGVHKRPAYRDYNLRAPTQLLHAAKQQGLDHVLTTYAAENEVQRYLFLSRYDLYVRPDDLPLWQSLIMKLGGVRGAGNLRLLINADSHSSSYKRQSSSIREVGLVDYVSIPQLILDLLVEGGPCVEAAELLIERNYGVKNVRKV